MQRFKTQPTNNYKSNTPSKTPVFIFNKSAETVAIIAHLTTVVHNYKAVF